MLSFEAREWRRRWSQHSTLTLLIGGVQIFTQLQREVAALEESLRTGKLLSTMMLANEHIAAVEQQVGRAEAGEDTWGPNQSEFHIELKRGTTPAEEVELKALQDEMLRYRQRVAPLPLEAARRGSGCEGGI